MSGEVRVWWGSSSRKAGRHPAGLARLGGSWALSLPRNQHDRHTHAFTDSQPKPHTQQARRTHTGNQRRPHTHLSIHSNVSGLRIGSGK